MFRQESPGCSNLQTKLILTNVSVQRQGTCQTQGKQEYDRKKQSTYAERERLNNTREGAMRGWGGGGGGGDTKTERQIKYKKKYR